MTAVSVPVRWDPARLRGRGRAHVPEAAGPARHLPGGSLVGEGLNKVGGAGHPRGSPFESVPTPRFPFQLGQPRALARAPGRPRPPGGKGTVPSTFTPGPLLQRPPCGPPPRLTGVQVDLRAQVGRELGVRGARSAWILGGTVRGGGGDTGSAPLRFLFVGLFVFCPCVLTPAPHRCAPRWARPWSSRCSRS